MKILETLKSARVFYYFEEISKIPHISYHERKLSDYCVNFAKQHNLYYEQDDIGNVLIIKEASNGYENVPAVILQGHLDMVGDKLPDCLIDMEKEAISLRVEGDYIYANGTTLGGDDGIAIAYALAILESDTICHPRLEVVLTVCEEVGLLGASAIDLSSCQARRLINIDSEEEGILAAGCAGGRRALCKIPVKRIPYNNANYESTSSTNESAPSVTCEITLSGLLGGHSGVEINKGRANANILIGRVLLYLKKHLAYGLVTLSGGVKENVIPSTATAQILFAENDRATLENCLDELQAILSAEYAGSDPDIHITTAFSETIVSNTCAQTTPDTVGLTVLPEVLQPTVTILPEVPQSTATVLPKASQPTSTILSEASFEAVITALNLAPNGVRSMSADLPGLVETSLNLGVVTLTENELQIRYSIRSSVTSAKEYIADKIAQLSVYLGGTTEFMGDYPAWTYNRTSPLRDTCVEIYREMYGTKPQIDIIHAGLECGILSSKIEGLDCISFGPNLYDIHSPNEHMSISSVDRVWKYLLAVLAVK